MSTENSAATEIPNRSAYERANNAMRQPLTMPAEPRGNNGRDNEQNDLILCSRDVLFNEITNNSYLVLEKLGQGTFGQVVKCWSVTHKCCVAVKVIKNQPAYHRQAMVEVKILQALNGNYDADRNNFIRFLDYFRFQEHLCLVFELLQLNLYELIKVGGYRGFSLGLVKHFIQQILRTLLVLRQEAIIHGDLKPENVLLEDERSGVVKVIDFGSSCMEHETVYSYIQSRFYRSPEVVLAYPYDSAIDMWSLGCIAAELYLGLPLFPAASERDLLARMIEILGPFPQRMLEVSGRLRRYFKDRNGALMETVDRYELMTEAEFVEHNHEAAPTAKKYFSHSRLHDIITKCKNVTSSAAIDDPRCFLDFLHGLLQVDPQKRWNAEQTAIHPFITGAPFTGVFHPPLTAPRQKSLPVGIATMPNARYHSASWHPNAEAHSKAHETAMFVVSQIANSVASNSSHLATGPGSFPHPVVGSIPTASGGLLGVSPEMMQAAMRAACEAVSNPSCPSTFQLAAQPAPTTGNQRIDGFHVAPRQPTYPDATDPPPNPTQGFSGSHQSRHMADINENGPVTNNDRELSFNLDINPVSIHNYHNQQPASSSFEQRSIQQHQQGSGHFYGFPITSESQVPATRGVALPRFTSGFSSWDSPASRQMPTLHQQQLQGSSASMSSIRPSRISTWPSSQCDNPCTSLGSYPEGCPSSDALQTSYGSGDTLLPYSSRSRPSVLMSQREYSSSIGIEALSDLRLQDTDFDSTQLERQSLSQREDHGSVSERNDIDTPQSSFQDIFFNQS